MLGLEKLSNKMFKYYNKKKNANKTNYKIVQKKVFNALDIQNGDPVLSDNI